MKQVEINGHTYEIVRNDEDCFDYDTVVERVTDYFDDYDYIFGDIAYEKVRLKGYYDSKNKKAKRINDIKYLEEYIRDFCSFGCKVFLLKKIK